MNALVCVLLLPGIFLVMDEGILFPMSNFGGLAVVGLCMLLLRLRASRRLARRVRLSRFLTSDLRPYVGSGGSL